MVGETNAKSLIKTRKGERKGQSSGRFVKDHKYGFADRNGNIVIAPRYDGAMPFEKGRAKSVCVAWTSVWIRNVTARFSGGKWLSAG